MTNFSVCNKCQTMEPMDYVGIWVCKCTTISKIDAINFNELLEKSAKEVLGTKRYESLKRRGKIK